MKNTASKLFVFVSALAVSALVTAPVVRAANETVDPQAQKAAEKKAKKDAEILKKYDKNGNGVLDPEEAAARQANVEKMKALREKRKKPEEKKAPEAPKSAEPQAKSESGQM